MKDLEQRIRQRARQLATEQGKFKAGEIDPGSSSNVRRHLSSMEEEGLLTRREPGDRTWFLGVRLAFRCHTTPKAREAARTAIVDD